MIAASTVDASATAREKDPILRIRLPSLAVVNPVLQANSSRSPVVVTGTPARRPTSYSVPGCNGRSGTNTTVRSCVSNRPVMTGVIVKYGARSPTLG